MSSPTLPLHVIPALDVLGAGMTLNLGQSPWALDGFISYADVSGKSGNRLGGSFARQNSIIPIEFDPIPFLQKTIVPSYPQVIS